jgi:hypothetical protein
MTGAVPTNANEFVEQHLRGRLRALEAAFEADALTIIGGLVNGVDDFVRTMVEELRQQADARPRLAVLLTTNGGLVEPVRRMVDVFRRHYEHVSFIVPDYAFSAGTVLAMSGDDIYMDYYSALGPIDPQVLSRQGRLVPALGYLKRWEQLVEKAQKGALTLAEAQLMIDGFDQAELYQFEQARELSVTLLKEWLVRYKFKDWIRTETRGLPVTPELRQERAEQIARALNDTDRWHSHGHGISLAILRRDLNLRIDDLEAPGHADRGRKVREYYGLPVDYMAQRQEQAVLHSVCRYLPFRAG